ncbi:SIS domain-containing protein [Planctomonas sp. JC2975]|uniref:SIS domain-containing protein n=1 Tax=Planctomonas sp. JC2975 TaxID=2729626 RepID=UPI0014737BEF|nr:SIS domain-containing protein [Planctomonas sp. JC2975]NNC11565.1 SIS domain-containing protein [Planctomonas sp. JC2975]
MRFTDFRGAMLSQPEHLAGLESRLDSELAAFPTGVVPWHPGETVAPLAMGAAHHSTHALAHVLRSGGFRALDLAASEAIGADAAAIGDHAIVVTESGRSPEPIAAARAFPAGRRLVITNDPAAAVHEVTDAVIDLGGFADSRAYTVGFTAMLVAYDRLVRTLGIVPSADPSIAAVVSCALDSFAAPAATSAPALVQASSIDVVGSGLSATAAAEIGLLVRECLRIPATAYETQQYLHGPMESVGAGTLVLIVGDGRERQIPASLAGSGARFIVIGRDSECGDAHFDVGSAEGFARVAAEVVAGQRLMAAANDLQPFEIEEFVHGQSDTKV